MASATCALSNNDIESITTAELRSLLSGDFQGLLIDVREPHEHAIANIPGARLIPLGKLPAELETLPADRQIYVHCKSGMRSAKAVRLLLNHGFPSVTNISGGIDAWLRD